MNRECSIIVRKNAKGMLCMQQALPADHHTFFHRSPRGLSFGGSPPPPLKGKIRSSRMHHQNHRNRCPWFLHEALSAEAPAVPASQNGSCHSPRLFLSSVAWQGKSAQPQASGSQLSRQGWCLWWLRRASRRTPPATRLRIRCLESRGRRAAGGVHARPRGSRFYLRHRMISEPAREVR